MNFNGFNPVQQIAGVVNMIMSLGHIASTTFQQLHVTLCIHKKSLMAEKPAKFFKIIRQQKLRNYGHKEFFPTIER